MTMITDSIAHLDQAISETLAVPAADQSRPYWQSKPCPSWCAYPEWHEDSDRPGERQHFGTSYDTTLTLEEPEIFWPKGPDGEPLGCVTSRPQLTVYLQQEDREREAWVAVSRDEKPPMRLTLAEARELAEALGDAIRASAGDGCP